MSEILRFNVNVPAEVALRYGECTRLQGRYGEQVMYTLVDGRFMYVPPCVADRIGEFELHPAQRRTATDEMPRPVDTALVVAPVIDPRRKARRPSRFDCDLYAPDEHALRREPGARHRALQEGGPPVEREALLRERAARHRPQARPGPTAKNDWIRAIRHLDSIYCLQRMRALRVR